MKFGLFSLGIGTGARPGVIAKTAEAAERVGVATLWVGEHVVLFDRQDSKYPYSPGGEFPLPGGADWLDPFITLTFAAAVTKKIRLATGICLVPEHNPQGQNGMQGGGGGGVGAGGGNADMAGSSSGGNDHDLGYCDSDGKPLQHCHRSGERTGCKHSE